MAAERCFCPRCHPTGLVESAHVLQCSACGEEVRWGWRAGQVSWLHRGDVDHITVLGHRFTEADRVELEVQLDLPRTRLDGNGNEVVYTTRTWKTKKGKAAADQSSEEGAEGKVEEAWDGVMPEPEVRADRSVVPWPLRENVPGGTWLLLKPALAAGLEVARLTYARGPWLHAGGQRPSTAETWGLQLRVPGLDTGTWAAIGLWRKVNESWKFEHGALVTDRHAEFVSSAAIRAWIKSLNDPKYKPPTKGARRA